MYLHATIPCRGLYYRPLILETEDGYPPGSWDTANASIQVHMFQLETFEAQVKISFYPSVKGTPELCGYEDIFSFIDTGL